MESEKLIQTNKKIAEIKKRILLAEGQKKANAEEWDKKKQNNILSITTLKNEIKELTEKVSQLKNPIKRRPVKKKDDLYNLKPVYPIGAKNAEEACSLLDIRVFETRKQCDLIHAKYLKRQHYFNKLIELYEELVTYKQPSENTEAKSPQGETAEEHSSRKFICRLENEIHKTNVQWMEAEHIRKKYKSIQASLMNDAERFEKSLRELEQALTEQQTEVNRLQKLHKEAIDMRDAAKIILQKQEQVAVASSKARDRQAMDFRKKVEERKIELERIERTLFATGGNKNALTHQESLGSSSGDQLTGKTDQQDDEISLLKRSKYDMEEIFKKLMEITGATTAFEVLQRFISQKESSLRLTYLRTVSEEEKKLLENQREILSNELEASKFSDIKDNEVNQELLEAIKLDIENLTKENDSNLEEIRKTEIVIRSINQNLIEMIFKLQEVDETDITLLKLNKTIIPQDLPDFLTNEASNSDLIDILEEKIIRATKLSSQKKSVESGQELIGEVEAQELYVSLESRPASPPVEEKPLPIPMCYFNLMISRTGQSVSASPGPTPQPAGEEAEDEVPSRNYLKRQALLIVDSKSRRKGFRSSQQRRK